MPSILESSSSYSSYQNHNGMKDSLLFRGLFFISLTAILLGAPSCSQSYYYTVNEGHLLSLSEKKDLKLSAAQGASSGSRSGPHSSFSLQLGYSPIKHLGIQSNFLKVNRGQQNSDAQISSSGNGWVFSNAIGAYSFLSNASKTTEKYAKKRSGFLLDFYAGYARGKMTNHYQNNQGSAHVFYNKYFFQPGFHFQGRWIRFGYVLKTGLIDFKKALLIGNVSAEDLQVIRRIGSRDPYVSLESSFRVAVGFKMVYLFLTQTRQHIRRNELQENAIRSITHFGITIDIHQLFKTKNNPSSKPLILD